MSYTAKNEHVQARQLKTRRLVLPLSVVGHATPNSKTVTVDEPSVLFVQFEGTTQDLMTVAAGAFDTAGELSALTLTAADDSDGKLNVLIRCGEEVDKVLGARIHLLNAAAETGVEGAYPTGTSTGITSLGDKIVLYFNTTADFSAAATTVWTVEVEYVAD